jgi:hypothetical protein
MSVAEREIKWDTLAGRMIEARVRAGYTRRAASLEAGYAGISVLERYERGLVQFPREDIVFRFADIYAVDRMWLLYGRGAPGWAIS